jgi:NADPH:quinone reductase-like Zn-dependent oxidoreductase
MRATIIERFGDPEELHEAEVPEPPLGPDYVHIRVEAAGVNPVDTKIRQGAQKDRFPYIWPVILGWDVSGTVERVGPAVIDCQPGDPVITYCRQDFVGHGAYAEIASVRSPFVTSRGDLDPVEAGGLPLAGLTAYQALSDALGVSQNETVAVRGASGGVGSFAVQIAKSQGARVIAIAGPDGEQFVRDLGADEFLDYHSDDAPQRLRRLGEQGEGVDALLDLAGGDDLDDYAGAVRDGGRVASVLVPVKPDRWAERSINARYVFVRPDAEQLAWLVELHQAGRLCVPVAETFPLAEAAEAHRRQEAGGARGKLILTV